MLGILAVLGCGCSPAVVPPIVHSAIEPGVPDVRFSLPPFVPWASDAPTLLIVDKQERKLGLYRNGKQQKVYPVVLGRSRGRKVYEGDRRTPSGVYTITRKRPHRRFHRFLDFDYPNADDLANYRASIADGKVPKNGRRVPGPGGLLGIHGSEEEDLTLVGVNWTYGCIALANADMEEIYDQVAEGTVVVIWDEVSEAPPSSVAANASSP